MCYPTRSNNLSALIVQRIVAAAAAATDYCSNSLLISRHGHETINYFFGDTSNSEVMEMRFLLYLASSESHYWGLNQTNLFIDCPSASSLCICGFVGQQMFY